MNAFAPRDDQDSSVPEELEQMLEQAAPGIEFVDHRMSDQQRSEFVNQLLGQPTTAPHATPVTRSGNTPLNRSRISRRDVLVAGFSALAGAGISFALRHNVDDSVRPITRGPRDPIPVRAPVVLGKAYFGMDLLDTEAMTFLPVYDWTNQNADAALIEEEFRVEIDKQRISLVRDRATWGADSPIKGRSLILEGTSGGFILLGPVSSFYKVHMKTKLAKFKGVDPGGYAIMLLSEKADQQTNGTVSDDPLPARGIAVNVDRGLGVLAIKRYPEDQTLLSFDLPEEFDFYGEHTIDVYVKPSGLFKVEIDGQTVPEARANGDSFVDFHRHSGRIGFRVWSNSSLSVSELRIEPIEPSSQPKDQRTAYGISIGVDKYRFLPPLLQAESDAQQMSAAIGALGGYQSHESLALTGHDVRRPVVSYAIGVLPQDGQEDDTLIVYLAGHGLDLGNGQYYFLPGGTQIRSVQDIHDQAIDLKTIPAAVSAHRHGLVLIVLDHCHAGAVVEGVERQPLFGRTVEQANGVAAELMAHAKQDNIVILASADSDERAVDGQFGKWFRRGLQGDADSDRDGRVSLAELVRFTTDRVRSSSQGSQIPVVSGNLWANSRLQKWVVSEVKD